MRIVDNQQIRPATRNRASDAGSEVLPSVVRGPASGGLTVNLQFDAVENGLIKVRVDKVPDLPSEVDSQFGSMGGLNDLGPWFTANDP